MNRETGVPRVFRPLTDVGGDACKNDLALVLSGYCGPEVRVVPCIHLPVSLYQWRVWIQGRNLFWENAVGSRLRARGQDNGDAE